MTGRCEANTSALLSRAGLLLPWGPRPSGLGSPCSTSARHGARSSPRTRGTITGHPAAISWGGRRDGVSALGGIFPTSPPFIFFLLSLSLGLFFVCLSILVFNLLRSSLVGRGRLNPIRYRLGTTSPLPSQPPLTPLLKLSMKPFNPLSPAYLSTLFGLAPYMHLLWDFICENYIL